MSRDIDNSQDIIDSRDVIERIEELESERTALLEAIDEANEGTDEEEQEAAKEALADWDRDYREEQLALLALAEEAEGYAADWKHGECLIRESYFKDYAQQLAEDIGAINKDATWPNNCIDWDQATRDLKMDYTEVDYAGVTYLIR